MNYRKHRITIGNKDNRGLYLEKNPCCEICRSTYLIAVHHHIDQQWKHMGQCYIIDLPENYSTLCNTCHGIIDIQRQYERELIAKAKKPFEYWHKLKNGKEPENYVEGVNHDN